MKHDKIFERVVNRLENFHDLYTHNEINIITPIAISPQATEKESCFIVRF
jgi:hypothetical protein